MDYNDAVMDDPLLVKAQLPHTWGAFFARHGNFTEVQQRAIPVVLDGQDTLIISATASGKTEAVIAPLLERHILARAKAGGLGLLYICPTRALVRDLYTRLALPLQTLGVMLAMKSGDTGPVPSEHPPAVLLTTPESTDSLLTRAPRLFVTLRALVLDEIHLFDDSPRGDHLRCLLWRIEAIRDYHQRQTATTAPPFQRVALSATVWNPTEVAGRYLKDAAIVQVAGSREIVADLQPMHTLADLTALLAARAAHKTLLFCNTRHEVEQVATFLRQTLPYDAAIFTHYSNLDATLRRETERRFAEATVALCVSSSTLELGIDIGSIDEVALIGPPPDLTSFLQRIGRAGRRGSTSPVLCLVRSPLEVLRFRALLDMAESGPPVVPQAAYHFRPSVLAQQVFSLLKQSPTGGLRLADLRRIAPQEITDETLRGLLGHLFATGYLKGGRPGEWRPGPALDDLIDEHQIYSNIGGEPLGATAVDAYSGRRVAQVERPRRKGETLLMGGCPVEVAWRDRYTFAVQQGRQAEADEVMRFRTAPFAVPLEVTQAIAVSLGFAPNQMPCILDESGTWLFHFWGDLYGEWLAALLQAHFPAGEQEPLIESWNEICLLLPFPLHTLPPWDRAVAEQALDGLATRVEPYLELGRFHSLLPRALAHHTVVEQCDFPRFESLYRAGNFLSPPAALRTRLLSLL